MKTLALFLLVVQLAALAPVASASAAQAPETPPALGTAADPASDLALAWLAGLEQQGDLGRDEGAALDATAAGGRPGPALPPALRFEDAHPACDLDGDGVRDLIVNELTLGAPPQLNNAPSTIRAISGATGAELWKVSNLRYVEPRSVVDLTLARTGASQPTSAANVAPLADANGDGVCDVFAWGYGGNGVGFSALVAGMTPFRSNVRVLDGRNGQPLWSLNLPGETLTVTAPTASESRINGTPTGFVPILTAQGPKILVKTTDIEYTSWTSLLAVPRLPILQTQLLKGAPQYRSARIDEHLLMLDAKTGKADWSRDILQAGDAKFSNVTWISGAGDVLGDDGLEVVLDQFVITNPRANEMNNPVDGSTMYRFGRGMRAMALSGATGDTAWTSVVLDPLLVSPNPPVEENHESLAWTSATIGPDLDGDGKHDIIASYVAQEENLGRALPGAIRTHFVALHGANGTKMWDVRQQGWGVMRADDTGARASGHAFLAFGMVDVPTPTQSNARFPPKFVRMGVVDGTDGSTVWSYERQFAQNSYLSYNLGLAQFETALATMDIDHDGRLDLLTPAQYTPATGNDQVLLSTSTHSYQLLSGLDGAVLQTYDVWGPQGRALACGDSGNVTILSGHGRRVDITRLDAATGAQVWRRPVFNDAAPHAATSGVDVDAMGGACGDGPDGRTLAAVNLQLTSGQRGREVVPLLAGFDRATGATRFLTPELRGDPTTSEALLRASVATIRGDAPPPSLVPPLLVGGVLGVGGGIGAISLARKGIGRMGKLLAVALGLILLAGPVSALGLSVSPQAPATTEPAPEFEPAPSALSPAPSALGPGANAPSPLPDSPLSRLVAGEHALGEAWTSGAHVALVNTYLRESGTIREPFDANASLPFTYALPDIDGDASPDVLVDTFCEDFSACSFLDMRIPEDAANFATKSQCGGNPHHLLAMDGRNKSILWDIDMMPNIPWGNCGGTHLIGTATLPDGRTGILVYRYVSYGSWGEFVANPIENTLVMLDARDGSEIWSFVERGTFSTDIFLTETSQSLFLNPVLATDAKGATVLLVQGVGYQSTAATSVFPLDPLGFLTITNQPFDVVDSYTPLEWAAALDPLTGHVQWRVDTFRDVTTQNILPKLQDGMTYDNVFNADGIAAEKYWGQTPPMPAVTPQLRVFDVTGDGVPDLLYHVMEWSRTPTTKAAAPFFYDSRLVAIDGASGKTVIDRYVTRDIQAPAGGARHSNSFMGFAMRGPNYMIYFEALGDVNGDGTPDMVQHELFGERDFRHVVTIVNGKDGKPIWNLTMPRDVRTIMPGDADGDGAPDVLFVDWFSHESGGRKSDDYDTPGALPLVLRSGADGHTIWRAVTYAAPADAVWQFVAMTRNGALDLNSDGVMDVPLDAPEYLGDQSVIHHITIASGKDASPIETIRTVGAFGLVASAGGDITGDHKPDFAVLSGDASDLWITLHDGATGAALWSHRAVQIATSGYTTALPKLSLHALRQANGTVGALGMDLQVLVTHSGFASGISVGSTLTIGTFSSTFTSTTPQVMSIDAATGDALWGLPDPANVHSVVGSTPGTKMYDMVLERANHQATTAAADAAPVALPGALAFGVAFPITFGAGVGIVRFARRFEGVPDLV